ncbi:UNVERIFIED_ORG: hypothetical protein GGI63_004782 [Rhizobium esperanzae]|nr:hypothetical protein [Rhizobium phaseoli]EGE60830.1 hypothetical protein RHECNPAF_1340082 [Rhizobium etli CNPAF512]
MITLKSELKLKQIARECEVHGQNILFETDGRGGRKKGRYFRLSAALMVASLSVCCATTPSPAKPAIVLVSEGAREGDDRAMIVVVAALRPAGRVGERETGKEQGGIGGDNPVPAVP